VSRLQVDGGCHCGRVRFRAVVDPARVTVCHCTDCQSLTGTAFRATVETARDDLEVEGTPAIYTKTAESGRPRHQHFCADCGSPLFTSGEGDAAQVFGVRWGAISQRSALAPTHEIWRRSAPPWTCAFSGTAVSETE